MFQKVLVLIFCFPLLVYATDPRDALCAPWLAALNGDSEPQLVYPYYNGGTEKAIELVQKQLDLEANKDRPVVVAIYGYPNQGKSQLIKRLTQHFRDNLQVSTYPMAGHAGSQDRDAIKSRKYRLALLHIANDRYKGTQDIDEVEFKQNTGLDHTLNIYIVNPKDYKLISAEDAKSYDLILVNPDSTKKRKR